MLVTLPVVFSAEKNNELIATDPVDRRMLVLFADDGTAALNISVSVAVPASIIYIFEIILLIARISSPLSIQLFLLLCFV